jgi:divalent metal cation (Fe/Co/Zn/Cd) transporter
MYIGPDRLIVAARVAFSDQIDADAVEDLAERIDRELSAELPAIPHVFIDPTDTASGSRGGGRSGPLLPEPLPEPEPAAEAG